MTKQEQKLPSRLTMKEAAHYVNERLARPWTNPKSTLESNVYREKLKISAHGKRNNKRTFMIKELDRFIKAKNESAAPAGGQTRKDLSKYTYLFGYCTDRRIATLAGCSPVTVMRYRKKNNIASFPKASLIRILGIKERMGQEPAGKLAIEIGVNRMAIVKFMQEHNIPAYRRK